MKRIVPHHITHEGESFAHAGDGKTRGSHAFFSVRTGKMIELQEAVIVREGPLYYLATVPANNALASVRVEKNALDGKASPPTVGSQLLIGPIDPTPATGPRAVAAWPYYNPTAPRRAIAPANGAIASRRIGVISRVAPAGTFGSVLLDDSGAEAFLHTSQLQNGTTLRRGVRVSCIVANNGRGLAAFDVRLAA